VVLITKADSHVVGGEDAKNEKARSVDVFVAN
jgi:hypothetical protein